MPKLVLSRVRSLYICVRLTIRHSGLSMHRLSPYRQLLGSISARVALGIAMLVLSLALALASTNFAKLQQLAQSRYGDQGAATMQDWRDLVRRITPMPDAEKIEQVNDFFNERVTFVDDIEVWKQNDYWATPLETMGIRRGDCEDFSIAKYMTLQTAGTEIEKLRITYVKAKIGGRRSTITQAHMIVAYYPTPNGEPLLLDNLIPDIRPASRRADLEPVFGFNSAGLWVGGAAKPQVSNPGSKLSRWRDLVARMQSDGFE
jgi:predicted transglutaminase-like cysteine proteinase